MPIYVANLQHRSRDDHEMLRRSKNHLHAPAANTILRPADALRRTAFLDVSSLNFGGAKSTAVFFCRLQLSTSGLHNSAATNAMDQTTAETVSSHRPGRPKPVIQSAFLLTKLDQRSIADSARSGRDTGPA
jgi:hypothetical protein